MRYTQHAVMTALLITGMANVNADAPSVFSFRDNAEAQDNCAFGHKCDWMPKRSSNLWISGDLLYWTVNEDGFGCEFGSTTINTTIVGSIPTTAITEHDRDIDFDWKPGFRVGIGGDWPCSGWDTGAYWTWYKGKGHGHFHHNRAHWNMDFNVGDAVLGRRFQVGKCVNLRPFVGLRYAQIEQKLHSNLKTKIIAATGNSIVYSTFRNKQKFWGFGPELGLEADFYIGNRWSVYGELDGAVLYGHTGTSFRNRDAFALANAICNASGEWDVVDYVLDYGLGIRYELKHLTLQLGLEHHTYFDFNEISCNGDLNLYGANFSAVIHF